MCFLRERRVNFPVHWAIHRNVSIFYRFTRVIFVDLNWSVDFIDVTFSVQKGIIEKWQVRRTPPSNDSLGFIAINYMFLHITRRSLDFLLQNSLRVSTSRAFVSKLRSSVRKFVVKRRCFHLLRSAQFFYNFVS